MKIYYEEGPIRKFSERGIPCSNQDQITLNAAYGFRRCDGLLWNIKQWSNSADLVVYTNQVQALRNELAWNDELKVPEIYLRNKKGDWIRIDKLTNRELRQAHNLVKMYIAGEFDGGINMELRRME